MRDTSTNVGAPGSYADPADGGRVGSRSVISLVRTMKKNFMEQDVEIMPGLMFNQYKTLKRIHYYLNSEFEGGSLDENGNDRYFHNIINHRNTQTTKNIDLDTKDVTAKTDKEDSYWRTFVLRLQLKNWMKRENFGKRLNQMSEDLAKYGSVVWKKTKDWRGRNDISNVDLRALLCDQGAECLRDSQLVAERIVMSPKDLIDKIKDGWNKSAVYRALQNISYDKQQFMSESEIANDSIYALADGLPNTEVYEVWGWVPESYLPRDFNRNYSSGLLNAAPPKAATEAEDADESEDKGEHDIEDYVYIMAVVSGVDVGTREAILFIEEADPEDFPYKDVHMRKQAGRWLGIGNTEQLFTLQTRMNELVNRVFMALRMGTIHLFQTRNQMIQKNLLQDVQDGDIIESSSEIAPIVTEIRAFQQYQQEVTMIETTADKMCNTPEIVTGENLPANTPFRLGAQMGQTANAYFKFIRQNCGLFVSEVMYDWVIPNLIEDMEEEQVLDLMGSTEELGNFEAAVRNTLLLEEMKKFILTTGQPVSKDQYDLANKMLSEQMATGEKKFKVQKKFMTNTDFESYQIFVDPTGETVDVAAQNETLGNLLQIITSNPVIMQDANARKVISRIMENAGISPISLSGFISAPVPGIPGAGGPALADPNAPQAADPNAAAPGMSKFATNPGDASPQTARR